MARTRIKANETELAKMFKTGEPWG
jgi:hypothetical protein